MLFKSDGLRGTFSRNCQTITTLNFTNATCKTKVEKSYRFNPQWTKSQLNSICHQGCDNKSRTTLHGTMASRVCSNDGLSSLLAFLVPTSPLHLEQISTSAIKNYEIHMIFIDLEHSPKNPENPAKSRQVIAGIGRISV